MFVLAAALAATASASSAPATAPVVVQATATVRIISGVRVKLDSPTNRDAPPAHDALVTTNDGTAHHARLIEFQ